MKLDLKAFKKVHEDGNKAVLRHSDGHEIHISKEKLKPDQAQQLQALPFHQPKPKNYDEGGEVESDPSITNDEWKERWGKMAKGARKAYADGGEATSAIDTFLDHEQPQAVLPDGPTSQMPAQESPQDAFIASMGQEHAQTPEVAAGLQAPADVIPDQGPAPASLAPTPTAAPQSVSTGASLGSDPFVNASQSTLDTTAKGIQQQAQGIQQEAAATGALGKEQAELQHQAASDRQASMAKYEDHLAALDQERATFLHDVQTGQINPSHYLDSQSTGQKVLAGIGLLLGGLGQGGGGPNMALETINKNIDRDIKAQEANLGAKKSLLDFNLKQYGNLKDAMDVTRANLTDVAAAHLAEAAAKAQDPIAKARAQQALGELQQKSASVMGQLALRRAALGGAASGQDPSRLIPILVPEGERAKAFEEAKHAEDVNQAKAATLQAFDKAAANAKFLPQGRAGVKAFKALLSANLGHVEGSVRQAAMDAADQNLAPEMFDAKTSLQSKRKSVENWFQSGSATPILKAYGINPENFASTKHAPESEIKYKDGVPYKRVGNNMVRVK